MVLLKTLVLWALNTSEAVQNLIKTAYKQTRRDDDKNQPKSVQPWFSDSYRRKYYLIEGLEDTHFRVYRENDGKTSKTNTWFSIAGSIEEVTALADKFEGEGTTLGRVNGGRIRAAIPRFEAGDEVGTILRNRLYVLLTMCSRSESAGITDLLARQLLPAQSLDFLYTKVEQEESECDTLTQMGKRTRMLHLREGQCEIRVTQHPLRVSQQ